MKIFDCFMFSDEKMLLDIRLNVLNDYVDEGKWNSLSVEFKHESVETMSFCELLYMAIYCYIWLYGSYRPPRGL